MSPEPFSSLGILETPEFFPHGPRTDFHTKRAKFEPVPPFVSVSIVVYRNDAVQVTEVLSCLSSSGLPVSVTVVDNSPEDALRPFVEAAGAEYFFNGGNIGFGAAHNIAIRRYVGRSAYHLILNPDLTFGAETIPALYGFMQENPGVGLAMPKIFYPDNKEQRLCKLLPTPFDLFLRRFVGKQGHRFARRRMAGYLLEDVDLTAPRFIPNLSGCFMFVRMEALQAVGLFDERFFLYMEDVDLCRRIAAQWETVFYPYASIVHEYGNASYRDPHHLKLHMTSAWKYFNKWGWLRDPIRDALNARVRG